MYYNNKSSKISANEMSNNTNNIMTGTTGCSCGNVEIITPSTPSTPSTPTSRFLGLQGTVTNISNLNDDGCTKLFEVRDQNGRITNFVITPCTYFINQANITRGMSITVFYDADAPAVLIYPPRLQASVVASKSIMWTPLYAAKPKQYSLILQTIQKYY